MNFENNLRDPAYIKEVDINNDGKNEFVSTYDDVASMYHTSLIIFTIERDGGVKPWYVFGSTCIMRVIKFENSYFIVRPADIETGRFDEGIDIVYIKREFAEAVRVTKNGVKVLSAKEINYNVR